MYCPKCHAIANDDAKFCSQCGQDLSAPVIVEPEPEIRSLPQPAPPVSIPRPRDEPPKPLTLASFGIRDVYTQELVMFPLRVKESALAENLALPAYIVKKSSGGSYAGLCVPDGIYCYFLEEGRKSLTLSDGTMMVVSDPTRTWLTVYLVQGLDDRDSWDYFAAVRRIKEVLPEKYHAEIEKTRQERGR